LLSAIETARDPQLEAALSVIAEAKPDVILLTDFDWDYRGEALAALALRLQALGLDYPFHFAPQPNTGIDTGLDLDGNGRLGEPRDAQGYGAFTGQHGMALLSRLPIAAESARNFSDLLWQDLPGAQIAGAGLSAKAMAVQRLSSTAHWDVAVQSPGTALHLWAFAATTPVFDGPEDRNGRRNADEAGFWLRYLNGELPQQPAPGPFVLLGNANLDLTHGEGRREALAALLDDPRLTDPQPRSADAPADHPLATAVFGTAPGPLRVDYILPSAQLKVIDAGVIWSQAAALASKHRLVWVDLDLP
jgi:endonuclease/exonuclease/phosphatase family metal-dependent hydrolase